MLSPAAAAPPFLNVTPLGIEMKPFAQRYEAWPAGRAGLSEPAGNSKESAMEELDSVSWSPHMPNTSGVVNLQEFSIVTMYLYVEQPGIYNEFIPSSLLTQAV